MRTVSGLFSLLFVFNGDFRIFSLTGEKFCCATSDNSDDLSWPQNWIPKGYSGSRGPGSCRLTSKKIPESTMVLAIMRAYSVTKLNMKSMEFAVDIDVNITWEDPRLTIPPDSDLSGGSTISQDIARKLWFPRLRFTNCGEGDNRLVAPDISGATSTIFVSNSGKNHTALLAVNYRKTFRFSCFFQFESYPFDVQRCSIMMRFAYDRSCPVGAGMDLRFKPDLRVPPGFQLLAVSVNDRLASPFDKWSFRLKSMDFKIQRVYAQHLMLIFVPSILIVMLSWVSFWLEAEVAAPRVALGLTTILTLSTMFNSAQKDLPPVADIKALDIWMFSCIFMVFSSLIEFSVAFYFRKRKPKEQPIRAVPKHHYFYSDIYPRQANKIFEVEEISWRAWLCGKFRDTLKPNPATSLIDYTARIVFPTAFLVFNICFWKYYL